MAGPGETLTAAAKAFEPARDYSPPRYEHRARDAFIIGVSSIMDPWPLAHERPWFSSPFRDRFALAGDAMRAFVTFGQSHYRYHGSEGDLDQDRLFDPSRL
jgi:hypothetical protein